MPSPSHQSQWRWWFPSLGKYQINADEMTEDTSLVTESYIMILIFLKWRSFYEAKQQLVKQLGCEPSRSPQTWTEDRLDSWHMGFFWFDKTRVSSQQLGFPWSQDQGGVFTKHIIHTERGCCRTSNNFLVYLQLPHHIFSQFLKVKIGLLYLDE